MWNLLTKLSLLNTTIKIFIYLEHILEQKSN